MLHDKLCDECIEKTPESAIAWFLMASYAYYVLDKPILTDACYDMLCMYINDNWLFLFHPHKDLISKEDLESGTGYYLKEEDYPTIVKNSARRLINA